MRRRLPAWFKQKIPDPSTLRDMEDLLGEKGLHTICESALCPNMGQCFSKNTATFLILGDICTRHCTFCAVKKGVPVPPDADEPDHITEAVHTLNLKYVVITSVTRDDLPDGGAHQFAATIEALHARDRALGVEVLIPDFNGNPESLEAVIKSGPQVINHNVETVPRLYGTVRPQATYRRSLDLLTMVKEKASGIVTKSGLMVGLGETTDEVVEAMADLREQGCDLLTIGQYLQPSQSHHPIITFVPPVQFDEYEQIGLAMGFKGVASAPLVRSSYKAAELYANTRLPQAPLH